MNNLANTKSLEQIIADLKEELEKIKQDQYQLVEAAGRQIAQLHQKIVFLTHKPKSDNESYTGWWVAKECKDGSLILQSDTGERRHIWQEGSKKPANIPPKT